MSYGFWQREYGGRADVIGKSIALDGHPFTIIGVSQRDFRGVQIGRAFDVATPLGTEPIVRGKESSLDRRSNWWLTVVGRLAPGQTQEQAQARLRDFQPQVREATMPQDWPADDLKEYLNEPFTLMPGSTGISNLRDRYSQPLYVLLGIVGLVLTIACANMANLLLAQSVARRKELAVRLSLGAGRWRLVRQLLVESIMLSTIGAVAGLLIARWGSRAIVAMLSTRTQIVEVNLAMDWRVFAFTTAVGVITGLLFGVAPAFRGTRLTPADALRDHSRGVVSGGGRFQIGHALVAMQVALSFVLVFGSTLFVRTLVALTSQEMGFESSHVLVGNLDLRATGVTPENRLQMFTRVREALSAVAGHRGRGHVVRDAGQRLDVEPRDQRARLRRQRSPRRAVQRRLAELLQDDGDAAPRGPRYRRHRSRGRAGRDHRQRSLREEILQRREPDRPAVRHRRLQRALPDPASWRSSAWSPTRSTSGCARPRSRSCTAPSRRSARSIPARAW